MPKKMLIDATHPEETRVVVLDGNKVEDFDFESATKRQIAGNIYLAKVTRVEPSLQACFVEYGGNRHGFLAFGEIHPDYYQIPVADRQAILAEERALAASQSDDDEDGSDGEASDSGQRRRRGRGQALRAAEAVTAEDAAEAAEDGSDEGLSPMATVGETPVETPAADETDEEGGVETVEKDDTIEVVAEEDDPLAMRPSRKAVRLRRYKIQEVIKVRQIMLVQVVKEERGNKGAALTTYLSLAGRYCVLMPNTARGGGISRKITNAADRKKLKEIASELQVPEGAGLIIRTAGAQRTKAEIKRDYEYLQRLWEQIRELTLKSIAPAKIYEEGDIIKRSIRDLYSKDIEEVLVEGEEGYRNARDFMKMIMPGHVGNVVHYTDPLPLFARYGVESFLASMFNPVVQLPSGGYIVIGVTEALVAIDVNSGRATKEGSIEQTALKTNLEAADEIARQLRLRDLAGLIVLDFIDMDERKNNLAVEKRLKERLKTDRARIQVGRISGFGLLEMSRQRMRPGMLESITQPCPHCHGTGHLRSDESVALLILRQLDEEGVKGRSREVVVRAPVGIMNYLVNQKREHIAGIERRYGMAVRLEADPALVSPDFSLEKSKTPTRAIPEQRPIVMAGQPALMPEVEEETAETEEEAEEAVAGGDTAEGAEDDRPRRKRRRRRRRKGGDRTEETGESRSADLTGDDEGEPEHAEPEGGTAATEEGEQPAQPVAEPAAPAAEEASPPRRTRVRRRSAAPPEAASTESPDLAGGTAPAADTVPAEAAPAAEEKPKRRSRARKAAAEPTEPATEPATGSAASKRSRSRRAAPENLSEPPAPAQPPADQPSEPPAGVEPAQAPEPAAAVAATGPAEAPEPLPQPERPKRRGWWSA
ncbi:ribonuclease E/G [Rubellimicrobium sp. CFH 75288]|uniref:Rne/Rng family ribonuclease n=1 Tax=Rubellimicrobium sp. CFH 75288 TaxID=2697034 RepID=UPI0014124084|nr:ribonuclease E/G [Rubellimicrobium sp. CFH 75288]NAZ35232.1 Rne/Rng family ribonuclease [Rubellimicrobium sp. CFH 75288]